MDFNPPCRRIQGYTYLVMLGDPTKNSYFYCSTHTGKEFDTNIKVFLKCIPYEKPNAIEQIDNECSIQTQLNHLYIMPLDRHFEFKKYHYLEMPLATGPISNYMLTSINQIYKIMYQITHAVVYMHSQSILHGDINPNNIVLMQIDDKNPFPRLIDFGFAQRLKEDKPYCTCHKMTKVYSAPEVLGLEAHSFPSDIFSLGATFYYMITHKKILHDDDINKMKDDAKKITLSYTNIYNDERNFGKSFPQSGKTLIRKMLDANPEKRPTAQMVLDDQFFVEVLGTEWIAEEKKKIALAAKNKEIADVLSQEEETKQKPQPKQEEKEKKKQKKHKTKNKDKDDDGDNEDYDIDVKDEFY